MVKIRGKFAEAFGGRQACLRTEFWRIEIRDPVARESLRMYGGGATKILEHMEVENRKFISFYLGKINKDPLGVLHLPDNIKRHRHLASLTHPL